MYKKFFWSAAGTSLLGLCLIGFIIILVDPFSHFHKPIADFKPVMTNQRYDNPGMIRNFDYNSVLVGTSMTEQFRMSEIDQAFHTRALKVTAAGAYSTEFGIMLDQVERVNKSLDYIFIGYDINMLRKPSTGTRMELPEYLYDDNYVNDVFYILNKSVLFDNCYQFLQQNGDGSAKPIDDIYINPLSEYSKEVAIAGYARPAITDKSDEENDIIILAEENIANITPYIGKAENAGTEYYIFIPPYSMLYWDEKIRENKLDIEYKIQIRAMEALLESKNIKLFYFMNAKEIVTELENYRDSAHYSSEVCRQLTEYMKQGQYLVTKDNYKIILDEWFQYVGDYDYEQYFTDYEEP